MGDKKQINLNHLQALAALLETRSVTEAAARIGVTQSAMSHTLRQLRAELDDQILVRGQGGMMLTPRAMRLTEPLGRALDQLRNVVAEVPGFDPKTTTKQFVIAAPDFLSALLMPSLSAMAVAEAPGARFEVRSYSMADAATALERGEVDLALGAVPPDRPGLKTRLVYSDHYACVMRKDHPLAGEKIDLKQFAGANHVVAQARDGSDEMFDEALMRLDVTRRVAVRLPYVLTGPMCLVFTDYIMTAPRQFCRNYTTIYPLKLVELDFDLPRFDQMAVWHQRVDNEPDHKWLRDIVYRCLAYVGLGDIADLSSGELQA